MAGVATDVLSGWRRTRGGAGPTECVGPDGPDAGIVTIHERQRPALGLEGMVSLCLDRLRGEGTTDLVVHSPAPITTREGEYGAVVTITGVRSGLRVEHTLGVIDGDDFHTLVHARSSSAAHQAAVRAVARQIAIDLPLGLGALRYRRFRYDPPDDWEGREHGLLTKWTPHRESAEAPSEATIVVLPARPLYQSVVVV